MHDCTKPERRGQEGGKEQDSSNTFLILLSSYCIIHCPTLPKSLQRGLRETRVPLQVSSQISFDVMGRLREALVLRMGEPMSSKRRKNAEQVLPRRRRVSSNNHNR